MVYNLYNDWCIVDCFRMDDGHYLQSTFVSFIELLHLKCSILYRKMKSNKAIKIFPRNSSISVLQIKEPYNFYEDFYLWS